MFLNGPYFVIPIAIGVTYNFTEISRVAVFLCKKIFWLHLYLMDQHIWIHFDHNFVKFFDNGISVKHKTFFSCSVWRRLFSAPRPSVLPFLSLKRGVFSCSSSVMHFEHQFIGVRRSIWTAEDIFSTAVATVVAHLQPKINKTALHPKKRQQYGSDWPLHSHSFFEGHVRLL